MSEKENDRLARLAERLARWRAGHGGRGRRIPEWVWVEARALAATVGVPAVSRALRLAPTRLRPETSTTEPVPEDSESPAFVELAAGELVFGGLRVEIETPSGRRARVLGGDPEMVAWVASVILDGARA